MTTASVIVFLYPPDFKLAAVAVLNMDDAADMRLAAAMGMMIVDVILALRTAECTCRRRRLRRRGAPSYTPFGGSRCDVVCRTASAKPSSRRGNSRGRRRTYGSLPQIVCAVEDEIGLPGILKLRAKTATPSSRMMPPCTIRLAREAPLSCSK